jgi:hypothetical protein
MFKITITAAAAFLGRQHGFSGRVSYLLAPSKTLKLRGHQVDGGNAA